MYVKLPDSRVTLNDSILQYLQFLAGVGLLTDILYSKLIDGEYRTKSKVFGAGLESRLVYPTLERFKKGQPTNP